MPGYIRRRGKGSWEVTVHLGKDPTSGRRRRRFVAVRGAKRDAERVLAEALHQRDTGGGITPRKRTVGAHPRRGRGRRRVGQTPPPPPPPMPSPPRGRNGPKCGCWTPRTQNASWRKPPIV